MNFKINSLVKVNSVSLTFEGYDATANVELSVYPKQEVSTPPAQMRVGFIVDNDLKKQVVQILEAHIGAILKE